MSVVAVAAMKGGTAKTTTCVNVGHSLAREGHKILLVDMDPQGHLGESLGIPSQELDQDMSQVLEGKIHIKEVVNEVRPNLWLAPSNINLSSTELTLSSKPFGRESRLKRCLAALDGGFDLTLIDCPPSLGTLTVNALAAADQVIIPMATDYFGMLGVALMLQTIEEMREELNPHLTVMGILATRAKRTANSREVLERTRGELPADQRIFSAVIPERTAFQEASGLGKTIFEHAPSNDGATAYLQLATEVYYYAH